MKANELRIGNLVFYKTYETDNTGNGILADISVTAGDIMFISTREIHRYEPIPLTEEWLLKFGFTRYYELQYDWLNNNVELCYDVDDDVFFLYKFNTEIRYVHQLQNLYFALIGEELTLVVV